MANDDYRVEVAAERLSDGTVVYEAWHPDLRGCRSHGATPEEALENLADARLMYLAAKATTQPPDSGRGGAART